MIDKVEKEKNNDCNENKLDKNLKKGLKKSKGFLEEFKKFAFKGNMIDMAIGVIIGAAFSGVVKSLTSNIITPIINLVFGDYNNEFSQLSWHGIGYGEFINEFLSFLIMAFTVFLFVKLLTRLMTFNQKDGDDEEEVIETTEEKGLDVLIEIKDLLKDQNPKKDA